MWSRLRDPFVARSVFLRALGFILLTAFVSLWVQVDGLIGSRGILPLAPWIESAREAYGGGLWTAFTSLPTLFFFGASDAALHLVCLLGVLSALAVLAGVYQRATLFLCWLLYLSLCTAGRTFLAFQWDILLLEVTFTAMFFAPPGLAPGLARDRKIELAGLMLLKLLLFKLVFLSGVVKLASGDPTWRALTALEFHYETQPLPTWVGWYVHQLPQWFHRASAAATFFIQLVVPFSVFAPRRVRVVGAALLVSEQLLIGVTGNYGFFNLIALALCLLLVADEVSIGDRVVRVGPRRAGFALLAGTFCVLQGLQLSRALFRGEISEISASVLSTVAPFRTVNSYGLFAVMTTKRNEILLEGSDDGVTWKAYEFDHKPGDLSRRPQFVEPHMPRLDWQMWFAALGRPRQSPWLGVVMNRLLEGGREVTDLLETDPFPDAPPKYIRAEFYEYHFTDFEERDRTGNWWKRTRVGTYLPARSL